MPPQQTSPWAAQHIIPSISEARPPARCHTPTHHCLGLQCTVHHRHARARILTTSWHRRHTPRRPRPSLPGFSAPLLPKRSKTTATPTALHRTAPPRPAAHRPIGARGSLLTSARTRRHNHNSQQQRSGGESLVIAAWRTVARRTLARAGTALKASSAAARHSRNGERAFPEPTRSLFTFGKSYGVERALLRVPYSGEQWSGRSRTGTASEAGRRRARSAPGQKEVVRAANVSYCHRKLATLTPPSFLHSGLPLTHFRERRTLQDHSFTSTSRRPWRTRTMSISTPL